MGGPKQPNFPIRLQNCDYVTLNFKQNFILTMGEKNPSDQLSLFTVHCSLFHFGTITTWY